MTVPRVSSGGIMGRLSTFASRRLLVSLTVAGSGGILLAACGGDDRASSSTATPIQTVTMTSTPDISPATPTQGNVAIAPTAVPTALPPSTPTPYPPLPPPPPRPADPLPAPGAISEGGQWYFLELPFGDGTVCAVFYLPFDHTFSIHAAIGDPSGSVTLGFVIGDDSSIVFDFQTLAVVNRTVASPGLSPVLDQIADTISAC